MFSFEFKYCGVKVGGLQGQKAIILKQDVIQTRRQRKYIYNLKNSMMLLQKMVSYFPYESNDEDRTLITSIWQQDNWMEVDSIVFEIISCFLKWTLDVKTNTF